MKALTRRAMNLVMVGGGEILLAMVLVLGLALVFLGILGVAFPKGAGLTALYGQLVEDGNASGGLHLTSTNGQPELVARLVDVSNSVRERPANAIAWTAASVGTELHDHHAIQTLENSTASIALQGANRLNLGEKSLVVIKRPEGRRKSQPASLVLLDGRIRGTIGGGDGEALPVQYVTNNGATQIAATGGDQAEFMMSVNADETSTLSVLSGSAAVQTEQGTTIVGPYQTLTMSEDGPLGAPRALPDAPEPIEPPDGHVVVHGAITPRVHFEWDGPGGSDEYHLTIARDADFEEVVYDDTLHESRFVHGALPAGRYYWTVQTREGPVESLKSDVHVFDVVTDLEPPILDVDLPERVADVSMLEVRGYTEPGAELLIGGDSVAVDANGEFVATVALEPGLNIIVIEAIDSAGNGTYSARYVTATGRRRQ